MSTYYWNDWYSAFGWFLWFGLIILMFSNIGNWGYTYRAHRRLGDSPRKEALDLLNERYARGEIGREEYSRTKSDIASGSKEETKKGA